MILKAFNFFSLSLLFFWSCESIEKKHLVYGKNCKLWLLNDTSIVSNGITPYLLCFDKTEYQCYLVQSNGAVSKRLKSDIVYDIIDGGNWKINGDTMYIKDYSFPSENISEDTIFLNEGAFIFNISHKFNIINCSCNNLIVQFKGGNIDSIKTLLNYKK